MPLEPAATTGEKMGFARSRSLTVTADGATNQTAWNSLKKGGVVTLAGTFVATATLQRRGADGNIRDVTNNSGVVTTFTAPGTYTLAPAETQAEYRLNCKAGAFTSGSLGMMIEGR